VPTTSYFWLFTDLRCEIVYTPEDVALAIQYGLDGVIISNHGGRQLDGAPATLDAFRECAPVAAGKIPIAIDGGIRRGTDIFKALALGACFCFVGRVPIWGLAVCCSEDGPVIHSEDLLAD
jgi:(S)-2-hydroxy-acid oxidase